MQWKMIVQAGFRLPFILNLMSKGIEENMEKKTGYRFNNFMWYIENSMLTVYLKDEDLQNFQDHLIKNIDNKSFLLNIRNHILHSAVELINYCDELNNSNIKKLSNFELAYELKKLSELYKQHIAFYPIPRMTSETLSDYFDKDEKFDKFFPTLVKPRKHSIFIDEQKSILKIIIAIKEKNLVELFLNENIEEIKDSLVRKHPKMDLMLENHVDNYCWFPIFDMHNPYSKEYYINVIKESLQKQENHEEELNKIKTNLIVLEEERKTALEELSLSEQNIKIADFIEEMTQLNEFRKSSKAQANYLAFKFVKEIAKRFDISYIELKYLLHDEIIEMLQNPDKFDQSLIEKRRKAWVCNIKKDGIEYYNGDEAINFIQREVGTFQKDNIEEIKGRTAQRGIVKGKVRLIMKRADITKLQEGEILVTSMTDPDMVVAMKKAAAIVTDEGGLTCHAAIVSRELGTPCVVATEYSTKVLKDGDEIEVDADKGIIRKV